MYNNNFIDRFMEEFCLTLLTKEKVTDLGVHVILMFTFVSSLYFYITSPSIGYGLEYYIYVLFTQLEIPYSFYGTCPNDANIKDINVNYKKLYDRETLNNNLVYILGCYFVWFIFLGCLVSYVFYNHISLKWIIVTNLSLMIFFSSNGVFFCKNIGSILLL